MADEVVKQFAGEPADPMGSIPEKRPNVTFITQVIRKVTLEVNRLAPKKSLLY
jgi:hypothetical protein